MTYNIYTCIFPCRGYQNQSDQKPLNKGRMEHFLTSMINPQTASINLLNELSYSFEDIEQSDNEGFQGPAPQNPKDNANSVIQTLYEEEEEEEQNNLKENENQYCDEIIEEGKVQKILKVVQCIRKNVKGSLANIICLFNEELINNDKPFQGKDNNSIAKSYPDIGRKNILKVGPLNIDVPQFFDTPRNVEIKRQITRNNIEVITSKDIMIDVNTPQKAREQLQKDVAYVFVTRGYGLSMTKEQGRCNIDGNKYNSLLTSVIRSALRKLFDILIRNMQQHIEPLDRREEFLLRSPMVNCRKWLNRPELETFFKIINEVYGMNHQPIYQDEVLALYSKLRKQLEKRSQYYDEKGQKRARLRERSFPYKIPYFSKSGGTFNSVSAPYRLKSTNTPSQPSQMMSMSLDSDFNRIERTTTLASESKMKTGPSIEKEIAELYVAFKSEESVFLLLSKRHNVVSWQKNEIKDIIHNLIKKGLKKVLKYRKEYNLIQSTPQLSISNSIVNRLLTHPLSQPTRVMMVQALTERILTEQRTVELVNQLAHCLQQMSTFP